MNYIFEEIKEEHLSEVLGIYNYYVLNTTVTFNIKPLTLEEMKALVFFDDDRFKAFAITDNEEIRGYAILTRHKTREAYDNTAEVAIYLRNDCRGKGIGSAAVGFIEDLAVKNGFHVLVASICGENESSIKMFEKNGYIKCAHYREVGRKFGRWLDVVAYQKLL
ncbi:MAG: GNAT family N-acetyltransferase [Bacillota bacterium]